MPNREVHVAAGIVCGGALAAICAEDQTPSQFVMETLGGLTGGYVGGRLPDILEPATSPRHREIAHSVVTGGSMIHLGRCQLLKWQQGCRKQADLARDRRREQMTGSLRELGFQLLEMFWRAFAGAIAGFLAGYVSHLVLDAVTPLSIRLV